jgi:hypothetical protein
VLTKLERKWYKEYLECFNQTDALRRAYPNNTYTENSLKSIAWQTKKSVFTKLHLSDNDLMDIMGLTDDALYQSTKEGMKATRPIVTADGIKAVPDYGVRHKYLETTLKLRGKLKDTSRVELTGADGSPLRIELIAGIGFLNKPPDAHN